MLATIAPPAASRIRRPSEVKRKQPSVREMASGGADPRPRKGYARAASRSIASPEWIHSIAGSKRRPNRYPARAASTASGETTVNIPEMKILVTGGGSGLGREFPLALARLGAPVAFCDLGEAAIAETESLAGGPLGRVVGIKANVAIESEVVKLIHDAHAALGGLNGLINNAGIFRDALLVKQDRKSGMLQRMSLDYWNAVIQVDLTGPFLCAREFAAKVIETGGGPAVIVNISSASRHGTRGQSNYSAAKAGLVADTKLWAEELAPYGPHWRGGSRFYRHTDLARHATRGAGGGARSGAAPATGQGERDLPSGEVHPRVRLPDGALCGRRRRHSDLAPSPKLRLARSSPTSPLPLASRLRTTRGLCACAFPRRCPACDSRPLESAQARRPKGGVHDGLMSQLVSRLRQDDFPNLGQCGARCDLAGLDETLLLREIVKCHIAHVGSDHDVRLASAQVADEGRHDRDGPVRTHERVGRRLLRDVGWDCDGDHHLGAELAGGIRRHGVDDTSVHIGLAVDRDRNEDAGNRGRGVDRGHHGSACEDHGLAGPQVDGHSRKRQRHALDRLVAKTRAQELLQGVPFDEATGEHRGEGVVEDISLLECDRVKLRVEHSACIRVERTDQRSDGGAGDGGHGDALLLENAKHPDLGKPPGAATAKHNPDTRQDLGRSLWNGGPRATPRGQRDRRHHTKGAVSHRATRPHGTGMYPLLLV